VKAAGRKTLLLLALVGVAALFVFDPVPLGNVVVQSINTRVSSSDKAIAGKSAALAVVEPPKEPTAAMDPIQPIRSRVLKSHLSNGFARKDWTPLPTPMPAPPTPAPQAPPLPFAFLGKQLVDGAWTVFLAYQGETIVVKEGQPLGATYHVPQINPPSMAVIYLPLNQTQYLPIGQPE